MSEDHRVSRNPAEPPKTGAAGARRWSDYLDWVREDCIGAVTSLSEQEQRATLLPSGWTPLELLHHLVHMEQRWFVWGFLGEEVAQPWGDWNREEPWEDTDVVAAEARWRVPEGLTAEAVAERLRAQGERTRAVLRDHDLGEPGRSGGRFGAQPPTLEWICFHVLAEYARHAGQLDVVVELLEERR
ncbi:DUF664 domain-containing protein [Nocardioides pantholopis]|uniref:mycothiol transferase n=1 Tax=Nocardioides pantholopis TaxID=2483798 RepID=UPI000FD947D6|nr:DUF664 domain-containing protein [Nocardioides pantholopis]